VAYRVDLEAALRQAREDAYAAGDFYRDEPNLVARGMSEEEFVAAAVAEFARDFGEEEAADMDDGMARTAWRAAQVEVTGPDSLLAAQPFSGTHSVIDMESVADRPDYGVVAPIPERALDRWFGTRRPSAAAVDQALEKGLDGFARWQGAYVIAYAGEQPDSIYFFGWSGD
jgi:hypothetical protein